MDDKLDIFLISGKSWNQLAFSTKTRKTRLLLKIGKKLHTTLSSHDAASAPKK